MKKQNKKSQTTTAKKSVAPNSSFSTWQLPSWSFYLIIFLFSFMLYSNTLWNGFAIDDGLVFTDNKFTKKGLAGIKDHFTHDMFEGAYSTSGMPMVSGGRYRPLSMVSFAMEYEFTRELRHDSRSEITAKNIITTENDPYLNPELSHGINVVLFALTCVLLYYLLQQIIPQKYSLKTPAGYLGIPFIATLLYAAHPIHTEAIANIKGRDEIMCMLFSLLSLLAAVKYVKSRNIIHLIWGMFIYFIALLSKENAITFFAIIPLTYFFFTGAKMKDYVLTLSLYAIPVAVFLLLRSKFTHAGLTQESTDIMNNPFVQATGTQHFATTLLTFLYYFKLLVFPRPLTHDYYYNQIPYVDFTDPLVILSIIINLALIVYALVNLKKKTILAFAILFYFITFSIASNIFFTVGTLMNERFIYMSSLGFCIFLAYLIIQLKERLKLSASVVLLIFVLMLSLCSLKTFSRNYDWKDDFTLDRRDIMHSLNSAKAQSELGGDLKRAAKFDIAALRDSGEIKTIFSDLSNATKTNEELNDIQLLPDSVIRIMLLDSSIVHLHEALRIYPAYSNAWLVLGEALYRRNHKAEEVIPIIERAGEYYNTWLGLGIVYNENNMLVKAKENLLKAFRAKPEDTKSIFLLAQVYAKLNQPDSVDYWMEKGSEFKNPVAEDYYLVGTGFGKVGHNIDKAIEYIKKAIELNPKGESYYADLAVAYGMKGNFDESIATCEKLIQINPNYPPAYINLSISYRAKGNTQLADQYLQKYKQMAASQKK